MSDAQKIQATGTEGELSQAETDYEKGKVLLEKGEAAQAAAAFHNALLSFEEEKNERGVARAADQLGDVCLQCKDLAAARKHFLRGLAICEELKDHHSVLLLKRKLVAIARAQEDHGAAVALYHELLDIYNDNNNPAGAVQALEELAEVYVKRGEDSRGADAYRTAAAIHANFKHRRHAEDLLARAAKLEEGGV